MTRRDGLKHDRGVPWGSSLAACLSLPFALALNQSKANRVRQGRDEKRAGSEVPGGGEYYLAW